jgi:anti-sigma regulatory factor (Ser/Thr protein kinase)
VGVLTSSRSLSLTLPSVPESTRRARRAVVRAGVDEDLRHAVTLLVSELVANCIRHAGQEGEIHIAGTFGPAFARIEVLDTGPGFDPEVRHDSDGFGLRLVDKLATRWGVERARGTLVWFEVDKRRRRFSRDT